MILSADRQHFLIEYEKLKFHNKHEKLILIDQYVELILKWNKKINLISPHTEKEIYIRHVLDCLQICPLIKSNQKILDIGSGGGFPSLIIAIMTESEVHAVEPIHKKCNFIAHVAASLSVTNNIFIHNTKIQNLGDNYLAYFNILTSRAFAPFNLIMDLSTPYMQQGSVFILQKTNKEKENIFEICERKGMTARWISSILNNESGIVIGNFCST